MYMTMEQYNIGILYRWEQTAAWEENSTTLKKIFFRSYNFNTVNHLAIYAMNMSGLFH